MKKLSCVIVLGASAQNPVLVTFTGEQQPNINMKKMIALHLKLFVFSFFIWKGAFGQSLKPDTALLHIAINNANNYYTRAIGQQLPLNNGPEYVFYNPLKFKGSAYFKDTTYVQGDVYYDGAAYHGVQLLYDLYKDVLTAILFDHYSKYTLLNDRVQNFDLLGHHFININTDTLGKSTGIKTGFYDDLYQGLTQVICKRYKTVQNYNSNTGAQESYAYFTTVKEDFFIKKDNIYYKVNGKGELLDILKDRKKQLQQYIKTNKIKFNKDEGGAFANLAAYYDQITK